MHKSLHRYRLLCCTLLAVSLAGCTPLPPDSVNRGAAPEATAPALSSQQQPQTPASPSPPPLTSQQQRVRLLIQQVEEAYAQGQAAYRKGQLADAKTDFDRAVDLMLTSGLDIKADCQLQDEFDRIVDGVNALEMD